MTDTQTTIPAPSPGVPAATPRNVAGYLRAVRELMTEATTVRRSWIRQVGMLILDARTKPAEMVAPGAGRCGADQRELFAGIQVRLAQVAVPRPCEPCQDAFAAWLQKQLGACDLLEEVGRTGDVTTLRAVQRLLAESRGDTAAFNATYNALLISLKSQIEARKSARRLFGRR